VSFRPASAAATTTMVLRCSAWTPTATDLGLGMTATEVPGRTRRGRRRVEVRGSTAGGTLVRHAHATLVACEIRVTAGRLTTTGRESTAVVMREAGLTTSRLATTGRESTAIVMREAGLSATRLATACREATAVVMRKVGVTTSHLAATGRETTTIVMREIGMPATRGTTRGSTTVETGAGTTTAIFKSTALRRMAHRRGVMRYLTRTRVRAARGTTMETNLRTTVTTADRTAVWATEAARGYDAVARELAWVRSRRHAGVPVIE